MRASNARIGQEPSKRRAANECYKNVMDSFIPFWDSRNSVMNNGHGKTWRDTDLVVTEILFFLTLPFAFCAYMYMQISSNFDLAVDDVKMRKEKCKKGNEKNKQIERLIGDRQHMPRFFTESSILDEN